MRRARPNPPDLDNLMLEVGGVIDKAIEQADREALLEHARAGRSVPIWEDGKIVWKPAAQVLVEMKTAD